MKCLFFHSMLHEPADHNSAVRLFRNKPVLSSTLDRVGLSALDEDEILVAGWDDQALAVHAALAGTRARFVSAGPRAETAQCAAISTAQKWADGWRGGLLATCHFDRGFSAPLVREQLAATQTDCAILIDPAAAMIDPALLHSLRTQATDYPDRDLLFVQAPPGLGSVLVRGAVLEKLAATAAHPGQLLHYIPDQYAHDPIATSACAPAPTSVCRSLDRFLLDTTSQTDRFERVTGHLNGQLRTTGAVQLVELASADTALPELPAEICIELTTRRSTRAIFRPRPRLESEQSADLSFELSAEAWASWLPEIRGQQLHPPRLVLGGAGDPLLSDQAIPLIELAAKKGFAVAVETDLVDIRPDLLASLAQSSLDLLIVHLPAVTPGKYAEIMGVDALASVLSAMQQIINLRGQHATPLLVPCFTKLKANTAEMEPWYDHWLRLLRSAIIQGPTTFAGQIADTAVTSMDPPQRVPCRRLQKRLHLLSNGTAVQCENDVFGRSPLGNIATHSLAEIWTSALSPLRVLHATNRYSLNVLCQSCRDWHRP